MRTAVPTPWADVAETHTATVFFAGDRALKVKKPVDLGFVDFRTADARRAACAAEVALNRRLAPDVYLGVADIVIGQVPVEHAVVMRRLPAERSLAALVAAGDPRVADAVDELAGTLARFHASCDVVGVDLPSSRAIAVPQLWDANLADARRQGLPATDLDRIAELGDRYVQARSPLFRDRLADGCVRDGHGDLLADDIFVLDDGIRVLDCLEFDDRLRAVDVVLDVAALMADLEDLGRRDLATRVMARYVAAAAERHPATLEHFFIAYRALVRAKVEAIRARQLGVAPEPHVDRLLDICRRHLEVAQPRLVLVGGLPGTGKTTVGAAVATELGAVHLRSDALRWELTAGVTSSAARYTSAETERVYAELLARARDALEHGEHVVLDATWADDRHREAARHLAHVALARLFEVCLTAPDDVAEERLRRRQHRPGESEADVSVRERMKLHFEPWPQATVVPSTDGAALTTAEVLTVLSTDCDVVPAAS